MKNAYKFEKKKWINKNQQMNFYFCYFLQNKKLEDLFLINKPHIPGAPKKLYATHTNCNKACTQLEALFVSSSKLHWTGIHRNFCPYQSCLLPFAIVKTRMSDWLTWTSFLIVTKLLLELVLKNDPWPQWGLLVNVWKCRSTEFQLPWGRDQRWTWSQSTPTYT